MNRLHFLMEKGECLLSLKKGKHMRSEIADKPFLNKGSGYVEALIAIGIYGRALHVFILIVYILSRRVTRSKNIMN